MYIHTLNNSNKIFYQQSSRAVLEQLKQSANVEPYLSSATQNSIAFSGGMTGNEEKVSEQC